MHRAYLGKEDLPRAVHAHVALEVHLAPDANAQFVARPENVIGWNRCHVQRRKGGGHVGKEARFVDRQYLADRRNDKPLKLGRRLRQQLHRLRLVAIRLLPRQVLRVGVVVTGIPRLISVFSRLRTARLRSQQRIGFFLTLCDALRHGRQQRVEAIHSALALALRPFRVAVLLQRLLGARAVARDAISRRSTIFPAARESPARPP